MSINGLLVLGVLALAGCVPSVSELRTAAPYRVLLVQRSPEPLLACVQGRLDAEAFFSFLGGLQTRLDSSGEGLRLLASKPASSGLIPIFDLLARPTPAGSEVTVRTWGSAGLGTGGAPAAERIVPVVEACGA
jgi:hypothetical protein